MYVIGVDVGTLSVRAAVVNLKGEIVSTSSHSIKIFNPLTDHYEQSSNDIWKSCCLSVQEAVSKANVDIASIVGLGFDATCSLVALDKNDNPVTVSTTGDNSQNVIVWMDHRAINQAEFINTTKHPMLQNLGGKISPEMQSPKLLWLKENLPYSWEKTDKFFDLADFMTYKATSDDTRSLCCVVCKWNYKANENEDGNNWDPSYWKQIGLEELLDGETRKIGNKVKLIGSPLGNGLTASAALELGLNPGTPVGVSIIDAHSGGIGMLGANTDIHKNNNDQHQDSEQHSNKLTPSDLTHRLALISGTSSCHMAVSLKPLKVPGVWGPYYSSMLPGLWLSEGGESATGALLDHIITQHSSYVELNNQASLLNCSAFDVLNNTIKELAIKENTPFSALLTKNLHVMPYFHGNRSPLADHHAVGGIIGLQLSQKGIEGLARLYLATIHSICYGTKHIIETMNANGHNIDTIFMTGGNSKNSLFVQEHANICQCKVILPKEKDAVLLGASILGAVASGVYESVFQAMLHMNHCGEVIQPEQHGGEIELYHKKKYAVFLKMYEHEKEYKKLMA